MNIEQIWIFGHSDQSAIALQYALKFPNNTEGLILSGTSLIGSREQSMERRKQSEAKRAEESEWFARVVRDWDYRIEHQTETNLEG